MLSYRHAHHAGNFADVLKHVLLAACLAHLLKKPGALRYLDTHAGAGRYPVIAGRDGQAAEIDHGAQQLLAGAAAPPLLRPYLEVLLSGQRNGRLTRYPGSPLLAATMLRADDRLLLWELHPEEHRRLARLFRADRRVTVHRADGPRELPGTLPAPERRALVLIDPAYERPQEYRQVREACIAALARMPAATLLLWYPLMAGQPARAMLRRLAPALPAPALAVELEQRRLHDTPGMAGCGVLVVNPPWTLAADLDTALPWLVRTLGAHRADCRVIKEETRQR